MMSKWKRLILVLSLCLNVLLITGGLWYHHYVSRMVKELFLMNIRSAIRVNEHDLQKLQSNDPQEIHNLTESLKRRVDEGKKQAEQWQKFSD